MARLRNHETFGTSVNCKTLVPSDNENGPTFTFHIFDTKEIAENGSKICAFEVWQRDPDKKRTLVASGHGLEYEDPTSDEAMLSLTQAIMVQDQSHDFHVQYAHLLHEAAKKRFVRQKTPEKVETFEATVISSRTPSEPPPSSADLETPSVQIHVVESKDKQAPKIRVQMNVLVSAHHVN